MAARAPTEGARYIAKPALRSTAVLQAVVGHLRSPVTNDVVFGKETALELLSLTPDCTLCSVHEQPVFGTIRDLCLLPWNAAHRSPALPAFTQGCDLLAALADSGKLTVIAFSAELHRFVAVSRIQVANPGFHRQELGRLVCADPLGRAVAVAAVEDRLGIFPVSQSAGEKVVDEAIVYPFEEEASDRERGSRGPTGWGTIWSIGFVTPPPGVQDSLLMLAVIVCRKNAPTTELFIVRCHPHTRTITPTAKVYPAHDDPWAFPPMHVIPVPDVGGALIIARGGGELVLLDLTETGGAVEACVLSLRAGGQQLAEEAPTSNSGTTATATGATSTFLEDWFVLPYSPRAHWSTLGTLHPGQEPSTTPAPTSSPDLSRWSPLGPTSPPAYDPSSGPPPELESPFARAYLHPRGRPQTGRGSGTPAASEGQPRPLVCSWSWGPRDAYMAPTDGSHPALYSFQLFPPGTPPLREATVPGVDGWGGRCLAVSSDGGGVQLVRVRVAGNGGPQWKFGERGEGREGRRARKLSLEMWGEGRECPGCSALVWVPGGMPVGVPGERPPGVTGGGLAEVPRKGLAGVLERAPGEGWKTLHGGMAGTGCIAALVEMGDGQVLEVSPDGGLVVRSGIMNLAPLTDFQLVRSPHEPQAQMAACCGVGSQGTLRLLRCGVSVERLLSTPPSYVGVTGTWSVRLRCSDPSHAYFVMSFVGETRVLSVGLRFDDCTDAVGFCSSASTLACGRLADCHLAQVCAAGVRVSVPASAVPPGRSHAPAPPVPIIAEWVPTEAQGPISVGAVGDGVILVALSRSRTLLQLGLHTPPGMKLSMLGAMSSTQAMAMSTTLIGLREVQRCLLSSELSCITVLDPSAGPIGGRNVSRLGPHGRAKGDDAEAEGHGVGARGGEDDDGMRIRLGDIGGDEGGRAERRARGGEGVAGGAGAEGVVEAMQISPRMGDGDGMQDWEAIEESEVGRLAAWRLDRGRGQTLTAPGLVAGGTAAAHGSNTWQLDDNHRGDLTKRSDDAMLDDAAGTWSEPLPREGDSSGRVRCEGVVDNSAHGNDNNVGVHGGFHSGGASGTVQSDLRCRIDQVTSQVCVVGTYSPSVQVLSLVPGDGLRVLAQASLAGLSERLHGRAAAVDPAGQSESSVSPRALESDTGGCVPESVRLVVFEQLCVLVGLRNGILARFEWPSVQGGLSAGGSLQEVVRKVHWESPLVDRPCRTEEWLAYFMQLLGLETPGRGTGSQKLAGAGAATATATLAGAAEVGLNLRATPVQEIAGQGSMATLRTVPTLRVASLKRLGTSPVGLVPLGEGLWADVVALSNGPWLLERSLPRQRMVTSSICFRPVMHAAPLRMPQCPEGIMFLGEKAMHLVELNCLKRLSIHTLPVGCTPFRIISHPDTGHLITIATAHPAIPTATTTPPNNPPSAPAFTPTPGHRSHAYSAARPLPGPTPPPFASVLALDSQTGSLLSVFPLDPDEGPLSLTFWRPPSIRPHSFVVAGTVYGSSLAGSNGGRRGGAHAGTSDTGPLLGMGPGPGSAVLDPAGPVRRGRLLVFEVLARGKGCDAGGTGGPEQEQGGVWRGSQEAGGVSVWESDRERVGGGRGRDCEVWRQSEREGAGGGGGGGRGGAGVGGGGGGGGGCGRGGEGGQTGGEGVSPHWPDYGHEASGGIGGDTQEESSGATWGSSGSTGQGSARGWQDWASARHGGGGTEVVCVGQMQVAGPVTAVSEYLDGKYLLAAVGCTLLVLQLREPESHAVVRLKRVAQMVTRFPIATVAVWGARIAVGSSRDGVLLYRYSEERRRLELIAVDPCRRQLADCLLLRGGRSAMASDARGELLVLREADRQRTSVSPEKNLVHESGFYLGQVASRIRHGTLTYQARLLDSCILTTSPVAQSPLTTSQTTIPHSAGSCGTRGFITSPVIVPTPPSAPPARTLAGEVADDGIVAGTLLGGVIILQPLSLEEYNVLAALERSVAQFPLTAPLLGNNHEAYRSQGIPPGTSRILDGDLLVQFLDLDPSQQAAVVGTLSGTALGVARRHPGTSSIQQQETEGELELVLQLLEGAVANLW